MKKVFKRGISLFLSLLMLTSGIGIFASASTAEKPTVYIIGDSTACNYPLASTRTGWGQVLCNFLVDTIKVDNRAVSGASSHSFYGSTARTNLRKDIKEGDYLLIQFGHNDSSESTTTKNGVTYLSHWANPTLGSDVAPPATPSLDKDAYSYKWFLKDYIEYAHSKGAYPILVTSIDRRYRAIDSNEEHSELRLYVTAMKELSKELAEREENPITVPVIDVWTEFRAQILAMESEKTDSSKAWFALNSSGSLDNTHLNRTGATEVARIFATKLKAATEPSAQGLAAYLVDDLEAKVKSIVKSGSSVTAISATIGKATSARRFIAAVYDGTILKDVAFAASPTVAGSQELQLSKPLSVASGNTVRVYYWNMAKLTPFIDFFSTVIE